MKTYFSLLDVVRFFAAFWVMNFHYLFVPGLSSDVNWYRYGHLGVQLFFIISGFVIVQSLQGKTVREFAKGRFIRLFPLFWILCTLTYLTTLIVPHAHHLLFSEYLISMSMFGDTINGLSRHTFRLIDAAYWTLTVELVFYITIGTFVSLFSYKRIRYFLLSWLLISMLAFIYDANWNFYMTLALVRHSSYFIFGGALSLIATKQARNVYEGVLDWGLLLLSALYSIYIHPRAILTYATPSPLYLNIVTILLIIFFVGISGCVYLSKYVKNKRTIKGLLTLGSLTYPLYLLHQTIGNTVMNYIVSKYQISWINLVISFEVFIIGIAYVIYLEDKKLRSWLKKLIQ